MWCTERVMFIAPYFGPKREVSISTAQLVLLSTRDHQDPSSKNAGLGALYEPHQDLGFPVITRSSTNKGAYDQFH